MSQPGAPSELPPPPPLRPRSVGDIITAAFDLYGRTWRILIPLVAIVVVPLTIAQHAVAHAVWGGVRLREGDLRTLEDASELWERGAGSGLFAIVTLIVTMLLVGAIAWATAQVLVGREPSIGESYRFGLARVWSILLVSILIGLAVLGGLILLVIPGLIFMTRLSVSVAVLVVEGKRGTEAMGRSWDLVRGHSWPVFGTLIVTAFLTGIVSGVLSAPFGDSWLARGIAASIGSAITTPFTALVVGLIYFDLRVRKEGLDVAGLEAELRAQAS